MKYYKNCDIIIRGRKRSARRTGGAPKIVYIITGHYGSGKTNFSINWSLRLKHSGKSVAIADLDVVNPYFRTSDYRDIIENSGIRAIIPVYASSGVDLPSLTGAVDGAIRQASSTKNEHLVIDVGGDDAGAIALGRYADLLDNVGYDMWLAVNFYRPETDNVNDALSLMRNIESASRLKCTGIVNCSNLKFETTVKDIETAAVKAQELSRATGIPLVYNVVMNKIDGDTNVHNKFPVEVYIKTPWESEP